MIETCVTYDDKDFRKLFVLQCKDCGEKEDVEILASCCTVKITCWGCGKEYIKKTK